MNKIGLLVAELQIRWREFKCRHDIHDYPDGTDVRTPMHFYTYTCRHCGKGFEI